MRCILTVPGIGIAITGGLGRVHIVFNAITPLHIKPVREGLFVHFSEKCKFLFTSKKENFYTDRTSLLRSCELSLGII